MMPTGPSKKLGSWGEEEFLFSQYHIKSICLICKSTNTIPHKETAELYFRTVHNNYDTKDLSKN